MIPTIIFISVLFVATIIILVLTAEKEAYKRGQVDAIEGKIKVNLVEFEDGERKWYYIKDLNGLENYKTIK